MKTLFLIAALAAAVPGLSCSRGSSGEKQPAEDAALASEAGTRQAWIFFTKNHNKGTGSPYNTDCVASVGTERIGAQRGYKVRWHIKTKNGGNDDDKCDSLDMSKVSLHFTTDVMGAAAMKVLKTSGTTANSIEGTISKEDGDIGSLTDHKYQVFVDNNPAGPDPIIVLGCSSCGPPPE